MPPSIRIQRVASLDDSALLAALADVLLDCVDGGASVSFLPPLSRERALRFWQGIAAGIENGERALLVAQDDAGTISGTVQLVLAQPENQPHRADVAKLLVHRRARRQGVASALMTAVEQYAADAGKSLLVLDTETGSAAEGLYRRLGWQVSGVIPGYALNAERRLAATTVLFKAL